MQNEVPRNYNSYTDNFSESLYLMGRLKPGVTVTQAATNVNLLFRQTLLGFPEAPLSQENLEKLKKTRLKPAGDRLVIAAQKILRAAGHPWSTSWWRCAVNNLRAATRFPRTFYRKLSL